MATGSTARITAGSGGHTRACSTPTLIGRHIATVIGPGVRLMVGRGWETSRGVGRRITTAVGSFTTATGPGRRAASSTGTVVGGGLRSWLSSRLISRSETISAGIRFRIISAIRIRGITGITIGILVMVVEEAADTPVVVATVVDEVATVAAVMGEMAMVVAMVVMAAVMLAIPTRTGVV